MKRKVLTQHGIVWERPTLLRRAWTLWHGLVMLSEGLVIVLSLGLLWPPWTMRSMAWNMRRTDRMWKVAPNER